MSDRRQDDEGCFEIFSALVDGEVSTQEVARACGVWRDDAQAQRRWSSYQLIGDVMRSDELADDSRSAQFLKSFRERLSQEPVVLAPAGLAVRHEPAMVDVPEPQMVQTPLRRRVWIGPMAVAASFVMVVGALVSSQGGLSGSVVAPVAGGDLAQGTNASSNQALALAPAWSASALTAASTVDGASFTEVGAPDATMATTVNPVWRDPQLRQLVPVQQNRQAVEPSFAASNNGDALVRNVVFDAP
ncbi:MAG: sigma-E factor negative regulatory protein [Burkholderiales bacterium]|nr:sigma-E factor negative regulatory protein [Burkholderiales bacterium]